MIMIIIIIMMMMILMINDINNDTSTTIKKRYVIKNLKLPLIRNSFSNRINIFSKITLQNSKL